MTDKRIKWLVSEEAYLKKHYLTKTNAEILEGMTFISKIQKTESSIQARISTLRLTGRKLGGKRYNSIKKQPAKPPIGIYVPKIKPYIMSKPLMHRLTSFGVGLQDIARLTGEHIEVLRGWIGQGGLPKEFVGVVDELCKERRT